MNNILQNILIGCIISSTPILQGVKLSQQDQPQATSSQETTSDSQQQAIQNAKQLVFAIINKDKEQIAHYSRKIDSPHTQISIPRDEHPDHSKLNKDTVSITTTPLIESVLRNDAETTELLLKTSTNNTDALNTTYAKEEIQDGICYYFPPLNAGINFFLDYNILSLLLQHEADPGKIDSQGGTAADINSAALLVLPRLENKEEEIKHRLLFTLLLIEYNSPRPASYIRDEFYHMLSNIDVDQTFSNSNNKEVLPHACVYTAWMSGVDTAQSLYNIDPETIQDKKPELPVSAQRYIACMQPITYRCDEIRKKQQLTDIDIFTTNEKRHSESS